MFALTALLFILLTVLIEVRPNMGIIPFALVCILGTAIVSIASFYVR